LEVPFTNIRRLDCQPFSGCSTLHRRNGTALHGTNGTENHTSTDAVTKQARFADSQRFDYPLLSDADGAVADSFGVKRGLLGKFLPVKRTTFVIDTDRTVLEVISSELNMDTHADKALATLRSR
jgi:peroxiredoxin